MILVTGGARSGKSTFAEALAETHYCQHNRGNVLYIATAWSEHPEMQSRIQHHQATRPNHWHTHEGHQHLSQVIQTAYPHYPVILLECVTTMLTNWLFDQINEQEIDHADFQILEKHLQNELQALITACLTSPSQIILVTNEIGFGIVPENRLARYFRDIAGRANQHLAKAADSVYLIVSGIDIKIKG